MRKRTIKTMADTIFWYLLYFLPVIGYLIFLIAEPSSGVTVSLTFSGFMDSIGFGVLTDNIIFSVLSDIFGVNGLLPIFVNDSLIAYFTYFIGVFVIHVLVDVVLFIPRLAHKWMNAMCNKE